MIGSTERSSFGGKISNLVSDVHIECEVPMNCQNGANGDSLCEDLNVRRKLEAYVSA